MSKEELAKIVEDTGEFTCKETHEFMGDEAFDVQIYFKQKAKSVYRMLCGDVDGFTEEKRSKIRDTVYDEWVNGKLYLNTQFF